MNLHPVVVGFERPCRECELAAQNIGEESGRLIHVWYSHADMICATHARRAIGHRGSASHESNGCDSGSNYITHFQPSLRYSHQYYYTPKLRVQQYLERKFDIH